MCQVPHLELALRGTIVPFADEETEAHICSLEKAVVPVYVSVTLSGCLFTGLWVLYCSNSKDKSGRKWRCDTPILTTHYPLFHRKYWPNPAEDPEQTQCFPFQKSPKAQMEQYQAPSAVPASNRSALKLLIWEAALVWNTAVLICNSMLGLAMASVPISHCDWRFDPWGDAVWNW